MKKAAIDIAEKRRHGPVDDSQTVDELFGFINDASEGGEGAAPSAFLVRMLKICQSMTFM